MVPLENIPGAAIFENLNRGDLRILGEVARLRDVVRGERLIQRGGEADALFVPMSGKFVLAVALRVFGEEREAVIEVFGPGEAFGWSSFVAPYRAYNSVYADAPGRVVELPRAELFKLFALDTALGYRFMSNVTQMVGQRTHTIRRLWVDEVEQSASRVRYWMAYETNF